MVGGTGFSWADEVEKEEVLQSQMKKKEEESFMKKPNPFGSARPREIVLQERGIDWRSLDTSFHSTERIPGKENRPKQRRQTSLTPKKYPPLESHRVPKGHQAAIQGTDFNCRHHSLPVPTPNAYLLTQSSRTRGTEAIQCPQIDASWLGEMRRPSCRPVDLGYQSSLFAAVNETQPPLESHRMPKGHQAAIQGTDFNCRHHSLPVPTPNAYLLTQSSRTRGTEAIQCPQIDASWLGEMRRPSCRPVDLGYQSSLFAAVNETQLPKKFDGILEKRFCYGHLERNYFEEQNSYQRNYVEQTRGGLRDLKHTTVTVLSGLNSERAHSTGNHKKRDVQATTEMHPANQRRSRRRR